MKNKIRFRKCKSCQEKFEVNPFKPLIPVCSIKCSIEYSKLLKSNKEAKEWRDKKVIMKENLLSHKDWLNILQVHFNTFIRFRDKDKGCISCGIALDRKFDAGHYYSVGHYPALRFDENNVHGQCVSCNQWMHGNLIMYAEKLPKRIGIDAFEVLTKKRESISKFSIPEIKEKIKYYKEKNKHYAANSRNW